MSPQPIHQLVSTEAHEYTPDMAYDDWQESAEPIRSLDSVNDVHILEEALSGSLQTPQCLQIQGLSSSTSTDCFFGIREENYTPAEHETVLGEDCPMINSYPVFPNAINFQGLGKNSNSPNKSDTNVSAATDLFRCYQHGCNGRQFSTLHNFRRHLKERNGLGKVHTCSVCGRKFSRSTARKTHQKQGRCQRYLISLLNEAVLLDLQQQSTALQNLVT